LYFFDVLLIKLGMRQNTCSHFENIDSFTNVFHQLISDGDMSALWRKLAPKPRGVKPALNGPQLVMGLVFHVLMAAGTFAAHVKKLTGIELSDSALSQRRTTAGAAPFDAIAQAALAPLADPAKHPDAFYRGLRLGAMDGSQFSVSNTPSILQRLNKPLSRRLRTAFAKVPMTWMVELGTHAPVAVVVGEEQESEWVLAQRLLERIQGPWLILLDRLYGVGDFVLKFAPVGQKTQSHFLARVKRNLKVTIEQVLEDGSALVCVKLAAYKKGNRKASIVKMREIAGRVQRPNGKWVTVRLWTDLLDSGQYPARELLALYARRWEIEIGTGELKANVRGAQLLQSHTVESAAQEILAAVIAMALVSRVRVEAGQSADLAPLRISFVKTLQAIRSLWQVLRLGRELFSPNQVLGLVARTLREIAEEASPKRRDRNCKRAVRKPVSSWPRLTATAYETGAFNYEMIPATPV
jgi:hypothetical protein